MTEKKLTPKQERFVAEYLIDLNATQATIRAGYSARNADKIGSQLLGKTRVAEAISHAKKARIERIEIDADWVLKRLTRDATADLAELYDASGQLKPVHDWPVAWRTGLVAGIETVQERNGEDEDGNTVWATVRKVKLLDRTKMVELIGRHVAVGAFKDQLEVTATVVGLAERMRAQKGK